MEDTSQLYSFRFLVTAPLIYVTVELGPMNLTSVIRTVLFMPLRPEAIVFSPFVELHTQFRQVCWLLMILHGCLLSFLGRRHLGSISLRQAMAPSSPSTVPSM